MTINAHPLRSTLNAACAIRWSGFCTIDGAPRPTALIVQIEPTQNNRAFVEAWLEHGDARPNIFTPREIACSCVRDGEFVHLEASWSAAEAPLLRATILEDGTEDQGSVVFAQTSLLKTAGFAPGGYDPPQSDPVVAWSNTSTRRDIPA